MLTTRAVVLIIGMLAASVWVGSLVALAVVTAAARRTLDASSRIALFRSVGRAYQYVGTGSLIAAAGAGISLAWPLSSNSRGITAEFLLAAILLVITFAGMAQARSMTSARRRLVASPDDPRIVASVRRGARVAGALRALIALVTLVMVAVGARILDQHFA